MGQYKLREQLASKFFVDENQDGQQGNSAESDENKESDAGSEDGNSSSLWPAVSNAAQTLASIVAGATDNFVPPPDPFQLNRDVFDNNLVNLENVWKKDRLCLFRLLFPYRQRICF